VGGITVNADRMRQAAAEGYSTATDLADYLVRKGLAFRDAHEAVARAVRMASDAGCDLADLTLQQMQAICPVIDTDAYQALTLEGSVNSRRHIGGTAPEQVRAAVQSARLRLSGA
jgi:argininosuccinate lyase